MGASCAKGIRAAAFFYGWPDVPELRRDLPVLCIVAESDATRGADFYGALWGRVMSARAPWSLQYASGLPHAFDAFSDTDASRRIIQQALAFWRSHLELVPQPPWQPSEERAVVEASYWGDDARLRSVLGGYIAKHPDDPAGYALRGMHLSRNQGYREAKPDLEKALALGSDDPGVKGCLGMTLAGEGAHARAVELLEAAIAGGWSGSQALGELGHSQLVLGRNEDAVRSYEQSLALGIPEGPNTLGLANYNLACGYARLGKSEQALTCIERAVAQRFGTRAAYERDADFAPLREEERFLVALDQLAR
jgi:tetratricopeptide (TPR) repeat protein